MPVFVLFLVTFVTGGVLSGAADEALPSIFEGRIHRDQGRPVTLGELLMGLQSAGKLAEEQRLRETIAKERREANEKARARFSGRRECSYHDDNFDMLGWNFYMMPELSARGLLMMSQFYFVLTSFIFKNFSLVKIILNVNFPI